MSSPVGPTEPLSATQEFGNAVTIAPRKLATRGDKVAAKYWRYGVVAYVLLSVVIVGTLTVNHNAALGDAFTDLIGLGGEEQNYVVFSLVVGGILLSALSTMRVLSDIRSIAKEEDDIDWVEEHKRPGLPLVFEDKSRRQQLIKGVLAGAISFEISENAQVETLIDERVRRVHLSGTTREQGMVGTSELRSIAEVRTAEYGSFARHATSMLLLVAVLGTFAGIKTALPQLIEAIGAATGTDAADASTAALQSALSAVASAFGGNSLALVGAVAVGLMAQGVSLGRRNLLERLELVSMEYVYGHSMASEGSPLQGAVAKLDEAVTEMRNQANAMDGVGGDLRGLSDSFTRSFEKLETRLSSIAAQQEAKLYDRTADGLDELRRRLGELARASETNAQVYAGLAEAVRTRSKETDNALTEMRGTNAQLAVALTGILEATRISADSFNSLRGAVDELKRGSGGVQEQTGHLVVAVGNVETIVSTLAIALNSADERLRGFESQTMQGWRQIGEQIASRMHEAIEPLRSVASDIKSFDGRAAEALKRVGSSSVANPQSYREDRGDQSAAILIDIRRTLDQGHRFVQKATRIGLISLGVVGGAGVVYVAIRFLR